MLNNTGLRGSFTKLAAVTTLLVGFSISLELTCDPLHMKGLLEIKKLYILLR